MSQWWGCHVKQLVLFGILSALLSACSGPIGAKQTDLVSAKETLMKYASPAPTCGGYLYRDGESLNSLIVRENDGVFSAWRKGREIYSSDSKTKKTYVPYQGESKEGFADACFQVNAVSTYFNYNDILPYFAASLLEATEAYQGRDNPTYYCIPIELKTENSQHLFSFLSTFYANETVAKWQTGKTLYWGVASSSSSSDDKTAFDGLYLSLNQGNIDRYDAQTFFEIAPDDAKGYPA